MKRAALFFCLFVLKATIIFSQQSDFPKLTGPYLGQTPPGIIPEIFAPGIISTDANEFNAAFTPDGEQVYFTVNILTQVRIYYYDKQLCKTEHGVKENMHLSRDKYPTLIRLLATDGKRSYIFHPIESLMETGTKEDCDFWFVEKLPSGEWGEVKHLNIPATPGKDDFYFTNTKNGTIYYSVFNDDGTGDIFSREKNQSVPQLLQFGISTEHNEHDPFISPDESY